MPTSTLSISRSYQIRNSSIVAWTLTFDTCLRAVRDGEEYHHPIGVESIEVCLPGKAFHDRLEAVSMLGYTQEISRYDMRRMTTQWTDILSFVKHIRGSSR